MKIAGKASILSLLMMLFSIMPQDHKVLRGFFENVASIICDYSISESQDAAPGASSSITIVEEELFHHDPGLPGLDVEVHPRLFLLINEYCKGISPGINLPPPDLLS